MISTLTFETLKDYLGDEIEFLWYSDDELESFVSHYIQNKSGEFDYELDNYRPHALSRHLSKRQNLILKVQENPQILPSLEEILEQSNELLSKKKYYECADFLVILMPFLPISFLKQVLKLAIDINDLKERDSRLETLTFLDIHFSQDSWDFTSYLSPALYNEHVKKYWEQFSESYRQRFLKKYSETFHEAEDRFLKFTTAFEQMLWEEQRKQKASQEFGNTYTMFKTSIYESVSEIIDKKYCNSLRSKAKILAYLYYFYGFDKKQQDFIYKNLIETIDQIPVKTCKCRSFLSLAKNIPDSDARQLLKKVVFIINGMINIIEKETDKFTDIDYEKLDNINSGIKETEVKFEQLSIDDLGERLKLYIILIDDFLFGYRVWLPNMIRGLSFPNLGKALFSLDQNHNFSIDTQKGKILYDIPFEMKAGNSNKISIRIARNISQEFIQELNHDNDYKVDDLRISRFMSIRVIGDEFRISPISNEKQVIEDNAYTLWEWNITPLRRGTHILLIQISIEIELNNQKGIKSLPSLTKEINIKVNPKYTLKSIFTQNWLQWLIGSVAIPILVWFLSKD